MSRHQPSPAQRNPAWIAPAFVSGLSIYVILFFTAEMGRLRCLLALLFPYEVALSWVDGDVQRFDPWDRVPVLLAAALILAIGFVFGRLTLRMLRADIGLSRLEIGVFSIGAGLSELSLVTLAFGLAGTLNQAWPFVAIFVITIAIYALQWRRGAFQIDAGDTAQDKKEHSPNLSRFSRYGLWFALPFVLVILLGGMMPPWDFDVREYHLQVPKEWFQSGRILFLPHNVYGNMPLGAEMHAVPAMVFWPGDLGWWWGAMVGKTVMAAFAPLTGLALVAAGRRLKHPLAGVAAALIYISTPWIVQVSVQGLNEGAVAFYLTVAVYAALLWTLTHNRRIESDAGQTGTGQVLLTGLFAGSAVACKYPALLFLVLPLGAWILVGQRKWNWKPAMAFALAVACGCGPWLAKNAALAGNPVYPLVFGGHTRTPERMEQWNRAHRVPQDDNHHCYTPKAAADAVAQVGWRSLWLSPLVLPLAALAFVCPRWRRLTVYLGIYSAYVFITWWLFTHRIDRFWIPVLPVLSMLAGLGVAGFWTGRWKRPLIGVLAMGLVWCGVISLTCVQDTRYLVSLSSLRFDVQGETRGASRVNPVHRWLNQMVPNGSHVLLVGDAQPFDLEVPAMYNTCFDENIFERLIRDRTREQRLEALRDHKISHIYVQWSDIDRYRSPGNYGFTDYITRELVRDELVRQQRILQPINLGLNPEWDQLFAVTSDPPSSQGPDSAASGQPE